MDQSQNVLVRSQNRFPWKYLIPFFLPCLVLVYALGLSGTASTAAGGKVFRAGASVIDVTPTTFPVIVNGGFFAANATKANDRLQARCLVLDDGGTRVALCVLDTCLIPREFADEAKREIQKVTGLPPERIMISATHTHTAPSLMQAHGANADPNYPAFLLPRLVEGFRQAVSNLAPARVGWASAPAPDQTHTRVWIRRPDRVGTDPFGERIVRANMHPGHENPDVIAPSGPSDPELSLLAVQTPDGKPIAVLANYSMHYHGGTPPVSADYFGRFADQLGVLLGAGAKDSFVGIMSHGTSGDQQWMDYAKPAQQTTVDEYAASLARIAHGAYQKIQWQEWVSLAMRDQDLPLRTRQPSEERLAKSREIMQGLQGREPSTIPEVYAREQLWLQEHPVRPVKLQALRVGELGIVMASAEVFAISGLKIKAQSPLRSTFCIELANGEDGYIPPPEHHALGSYNTWACRTACLEADAETKIVDGLLKLLEEVSGQPRRAIVETDGAYATAVRASKPLAYWRMNEFDGRSLPAADGRDRAVLSEPGVVFYLDGPDSQAFSGAETVNRAWHFAGGRLKAPAQGLGPAYSVEFWFWNGLPDSARAVTGHLFSWGADGAYGAPGEHLSIGGTRTSGGRLIFANGGSDISTQLTGHTNLSLKTWHHVVLVRDGKKAVVYLDGNTEPEIQGEIDPGVRSEADPIFLGGRSDNAANFEGKLDEVAFYGRALGAAEVAQHYQLAAMPAPVLANAGPVLKANAAGAASLQPVAHWLPPLTRENKVQDTAGKVSAVAEAGVELPSPEAAAASFSGGRLRAVLPGLGTDYSVAFWCCNELANTSRPVTAYLFSRGEDGAAGAPGDHLGIGGSHSHAGQLILFNGNQRGDLVAGRTVLEPGTWHRVILVREGRRARVFLDGRSEPEIDADIAPGYAPEVDQIFLGGRSDNFANLKGRMTDIAVFPRALKLVEIPALASAAVLGETRRATVQAPVSGPLAPEDSLAKIHLREGFQAELVAAEPLLESPVAIDWDGSGRLWVVEMNGYPLGMDGKGKPGGRVRVLEDTNGDGRYDKSTLFADGLNFPTGLLTWRDGVLITAAPEILFLKDSDGDGKADVKEVLFSGFFEGNLQLRVNGLRWGLDNQVYCASGAAWRGYGAGAGLKSLRNGREYAIGSRDFRIRPDTGELDPQSGPSQFGRNPDDWGNWFGVQNSWPLWHYVLADHYLRRNPHVPAPDPVQQVVLPVNPRVYPVSSLEKRFHSFDQAGHFTSACSAMIYRDGLLFDDGGTHAFTCEPFHNLVQHNVMEDDGVSFSSHRAAEESGHDFFASEDRWCRPVMTRTGPDGALWVVDMYRYMIEHPEWLPEEGRAELLPHYRLGEERGRIYRVFPKARPPRPIRPLGSLTLPELVAALDSPNGWQRDKAQMLLVWKQDAAAVPLLEAMARDAALPQARLQALCTLDGLSQLSERLVERALADAHPGVRANALRLAESRLTPAIMAAAAHLVNDPDPKVLLQLACTLGEWKDPRAGLALGHMAVAHFKDQFISAAILSSALPHSLALVDALVSAGGPALASFSGPLIHLSLAAGHRDALARLLGPLLAPSDGKFEVAQMEGFSQFLEILAQRDSGLSRLRGDKSGDALDTLLASAAGLFSNAETSAADPKQPEANRVTAAGLLVRDESRRSTGLDVLSEMLPPRTPVAAQLAAIRALGASGDSSVPERLAKAWPALGPESRPAVLDELLAREAWAFELVRQIGQGHIMAASLDASRRERLLRYASARVKEAATTALASGEHSTRAQVIARYRPALALTGNASHGPTVFAKLCAVCHKLGGVGQDIGPNLQSVANHPPEKLLASILDPSASIQPGFTAYAARLKGGEQLYGIIAAETGNSLVLKLTDGTTRTLLRTELESLESANLSLMPEGLEAGMTAQELADLIAWIRNSGKS